MSKEKAKKSVGFERVYKIWEYLKRNTDSEHPITQAEMRKDPDLSQAGVYLPGKQSYCDRLRLLSPGRQAGGHMS